MLSLSSVSAARISVSWALNRNNLRQIDGVTSWELPVFTIFGYNPFGASGHTTIYAGDINVIDKTGHRWKPAGGAGTIGAGSDVGGIYRSQDYLNGTKYNWDSAKFTRYSPVKE